MTHLDPKAAQLEDGAAELSSIIVDVRAGRFTNHAALADRLVAIVDRNRAALAALPQAEPVGQSIDFHAYRVAHIDPKLVRYIEMLRHECAYKGPCSDNGDGCSCSAEELNERHMRSASPAVSREVTEEMVEIGAKAVCAKHYADRFGKPEGDDHVQANVTANWPMFADDVRVALAALSQPHSEK